MAGRRARTGRGWDATPPRARRSSARSVGRDSSDPGGEGLDYGEGLGHGGGLGHGEGPDRGGGLGHGDRSRDHGDGGLDRGGSLGYGSRGLGHSGERLDRGGSRGRDAAGTARQAPVDPYEQAREICLRQLSVRPRTRAELATALAKRGIDAEVSAAVLDRYADVGLIDDAAFAKAWVTSRHHGRGLARRALASELRQRGVEADLVDEALGGLDGATEAATARALVERKLRSMGSAPPEAVFRRLVAMLARKGYPAGIAFGAVKEVLATKGDEVPEGADAEGIDDDAAQSI